MPRNRSILSITPHRAALAVALAAALPLLPRPGALHAQAADPYVPTLGPVHPINTIDASADDDADLEPMIEAIGDARVVVLGEATHSDGAVTAAKARVARFLHERMGFDALAWESGFLQCHAMNEALRDPDVPLEQAAAYLMAGGWASQVWTRPLFEHARDSWRGGRPLIMAGFDTGRPHRAAPYFRRYLRQVVARAPWLLSDSVQIGLVDSLAVRGFGFLTSEVTPDSVRAPQRAAVDALVRAVRTSRDSLRGMLSDREVAFLEQTLEHALTSEYLKEARGVERAYGRDRAMAETLRWLLRELYPDRKVIVWAATAHFIRNSHLIRNAEDSTMYVVPYEAGNHLAPVLGDDLYTIAFTTYAGEIGDIVPAGAQFESSVTVLEPAPSGSLEGRLHALGHAAAFVDLRRARRKPETADAFEALVLGRYRNVAPLERGAGRRFLHRGVGTGAVLRVKGAGAGGSSAASGAAMPTRRWRSSTGTGTPFYATAYRLTGDRDMAREPQGTAGDDSGDPLLRDLLVAEIAALPEGQREVFVLIEIEGFTHGEVAESLDVSAETSRQRLARARRYG